MLPELKARITSRRREMLDFARTLVAIRTENPPGNAYRQCAGVLRGRLRALGFRIDARAPEHCIRAIYGDGEPTLTFHGHYDVVPAATRQQFRLAVRKVLCAKGRRSAGIRARAALRVPWDAGIRAGRKNL